jgi:hypothetical protein
MKRILLRDLFGNFYQLSLLYQYNVYSFNFVTFYLKVVGNENEGGSIGSLLFEDGFRPWRSMSVYCLMGPSSFLLSISVSCL